MEVIHFGKSLVRLQLLRIYIGTDLFSTMKYWKEKSICRYAFFSQEKLEI